MRAMFCVILCVMAAASVADAQTADLSKYFASPAQEAADRAQLLDRLAAFAKAGAPVPNASSWRASLDLYSTLLIRYRRHGAFLHVSCAQNRKQGSACADEDALDAAMDGCTVRLETGVGRLGDRTFENLLRAPQLVRYRSAMRSLHRTGLHKASPAEEGVIAKLTPQIAGWQYDLYQDSLDKIALSTVSSPTGPLDVAKQRNLIAVSPDPAVREAGYRKRLQGLMLARDAAAFALAHTVSAGNAVARLRGFATAADEKYFELGFDPDTTRRLLDRLSGEGEVAKRFESIRVAELAAASRAPHPGPWDMRLPLRDMPPVAFADVPKLYHDVFAGLGGAYQRAFDDLIAPSSGRFDIAFAPVAGRAGGGFSVDGGDAPSMLFVGNFGGTYKDLSVLAHEGGHAVHRELMRLHGVPPIAAEGPHYLFESFAVFNELVLADYLAEHAADAAEKRTYTEQFLSVKGLDYLAGADDALLEQAFYDADRNGKNLGPDDLDALTLAVDGHFSRWPAEVPELKARWIGLELAYEDPLYDVNYVYGGLLALSYYKAWKQDRDGFVKAYLALLENGFDDTPEGLLRKFLNIDLGNDAALAATARAVVEEKFASLESPK
jgi:oligoendopeptidase F